MVLSLVFILGVSSLSVFATETEDVGTTTEESQVQETPKEEVTSEEEDISEEREVSEDNPEIKVFTSLTGSKLKVSITNSSEEDMNNTALLLDDENRYSAFNNYKDLGTIKSGESKELSISVINVGHGLLKNFCDSLGGVAYGFTFIGVALIVLILYIARLIYRKKKNKQGKGQTLLFTIAGITIIIACGVFIKNSPDYTLLDEGQNYVREIKEVYNGENLIYNLKYNQDIIEEKVTSKEEEIDFDVEYTYNENKPVTEETEIVSEGKPGRRLTTTTTVYRNGKVDDTIEDSYVIEEPVAQKEIQGTKKTVQIENIDAERVYVPDDTMFLGESKLDTSVEDAEANLGKKEVTYTWNEETGEIESEEKVTEKPGTNIWRAGTKVEKVVTLDPTVTYTPLEDQQIGYTNVVEEAIPGSITTTYTTTIDEKTGKEVKGAELKYVTSERVEPEDGTVEVGVLSVKDETTPCEIEYEYDDTKWDNFEQVLEEGQDKVETVTSIMQLDTKTGKVTDTVVEELSREVTQKSKPEKKLVGTKEPQWIEEKIMTDELQYNTVYQEDKTGILQGDEQRVIQKGENGSLYTTQMVACDGEGNKIEGYEPRVVSTDTVIKPVDEIILVAKGSNLLNSNN